MEPGEGGETDPSFVGEEGVVDTTIHGRRERGGGWGGGRETGKVWIFLFYTWFISEEARRKGWTEPRKLSLREQQIAVCPCIYTQLLLYTKKPRDRRLSVWVHLLFLFFGGEKEKEK